MPKKYGLAIILSASLVVSSGAWAQSNPSADDLIKSLTPTSQSLKSGATRGLHRLGPSTDAAVPEAANAPLSRHAAAEAAPNRPSGELASASLYVQFATGSAELTPQAIATLNELGKALSSSALSTYHFRIEGHTDTVGSRDYNRALSERRAEAVAAYIKDKFGVDKARMAPVGLGSDHLLVPTGDQTPEARNRRVQVVNLGA